MALSTFEAAAAKVNESLKMVGELTDLASLFNVGLFDVATLTRVKTLQPRCGFHRCWNMILHVFCLGSPGVMILWNIMRDYLAVVGSWISTRVVAWLVDDSNPRGQQVRDMNSTAMKAINDLDDKAMVAVISWASQWSPEKCTIKIHSEIFRYLHVRSENTYYAHWRHYEAFDLWQFCKVISAALFSACFIATIADVGRRRAKR